MKKQLLTITTLAALACFTLINIPAAIAKHWQQENPMRMFSHLNISDQQEQEIRGIFTTTRENNSVFTGEKRVIKQQMEDLMTMPSWDEGAARSIIITQLELGRIIALNRAKARNQAFNLLDDEQKAALNDKAADRTHKRTERQNKGNNKGKRQGRKHIKRLHKALQLTDIQVAQIQAIDEATESQMQGVKEAGKAHRAEIRAITKAPSFDEDAWLALHDKAFNNMVAHKLFKTNAKYDKAAILSTEQKEKFKKIMKKMKGKRA